MPPWTLTGTSVSGKSLEVRGVDLLVPGGQVMALIGPSGAGKSTLLRCVNRLVEPSAGRVFLREEDITALPAAALRRARRRMGMIFQEFALVERLTVMENVLSGRLGYTGTLRSIVRWFGRDEIESAIELLDKVGLAAARNQEGHCHRFRGKGAGRRLLKGSAARGNQDYQGKN